MKNATLKAELARHGIKRKDLARWLEISESGLQTKLQGQRGFSLTEGFKVWAILHDRGSSLEIGELFKEAIEEERRELQRAAG